MRVTSIVNRLKAATLSQVDLLRTLSRGFHNMLDLWPSEVFERGLCVYKVIRRQVFVVSDPALIEYVMLTNVENFRKSDASRQMLEPLIGQSMFITHGDHWRRQRRIATPAFHTRHIRRFVDTMVAQTLMRIRAARFPNCGACTNPARARGTKLSERCSVTGSSAKGFIVGGAGRRSYRASCCAIRVTWLSQSHTPSSGKE